MSNGTAGESQPKRKVRIDRIIGVFVQLRDAGGGSLKGLCPFHEEKVPSFNVTPARGLWYCFSCAEGGDAIKFLEKIRDSHAPEPWRNPLARESQPAIVRPRHLCGDCERLLQHVGDPITLIAFNRFDGYNDQLVEGCLHEAERHQFAVGAFLQRVRELPVPSSDEPPF